MDGAERLRPKRPSKPIERECVSVNSDAALLLVYGYIFVGLVSVIIGVLIGVSI